MKHSKKCALIISGGGSKGAFAVGVIRSLFERYRRDGWFSIVGGSSTGALITPLVGLMGAPEPLASEALRTLLYEYTHVETTDLLAKKNLFEFIKRSDCLNRTAPLRGRISRVFKPEWFTWLRRPEAPYCYVVYTNFQSGEKVVASPKQPGMTRERFIDAMLASASVPVLMEGTLIDGQICYDGSVRDLLPFGKAISLGAEHILPIFLDPEPFKRSGSRFRRVDKVLLRTLEIMLDETGSNDFETARLVNLAIRVRQNVVSACSFDPDIRRAVEEIFDGAEYRDLFGTDKRLVEITQGLRPQRPLTGAPFRFDPPEMRRWVALGAARAREVVKESPFRCHDESSHNESSRNESSRSNSSDDGGRLDRRPVPVLT
jgi:NTE family protein